MALDETSSIVVFAISSFGLCVWIVYWVLFSTRVFAFIVNNFVYFWFFLKTRQHFHVGTCHTTHHVVAKCLLHKQKAVH